MSIKIQNVTDEGFKKYGRVLTSDYDVAELIQKMGETPCPDDVIYVPSDANLEKLAIYKDFTNSLYGGLPVQIGYCNGHNNLLNAVEYHRSSEVNVACTDVILLISLMIQVKSRHSFSRRARWQRCMPQRCIMLRAA